MDDDEKEVMAEEEAWNQIKKKKKKKKKKKVVWLNMISTLDGYLMLNPVYAHMIYKWNSL